MRRTFGLGLAVAVFALAAGCGKTPSATGPSGPAAAAGIEGGWTLVSIEFAGIPDTEIAKKSDAERTITATADKLIATKNGKEDPLTYKIDKTKTPNEINLTSEKDGKAETMYGICKLEGDTLTICATISDKPADRPKEFKSTKENPTLLMILKKK